MSGRAEEALRFAGTTVDLTPPSGLAMGGYVARDGKLASGAHDPLEASLAWLPRERRAAPTQEESS